MFQHFSIKNIAYVLRATSVHLIKFSTSLPPRNIAHAVNNKYFHSKSQFLFWSVDVASM